MLTDAKVQVKAVVVCGLDIKSVGTFQNNFHLLRRVGKTY